MSALTVTHNQDSNIKLTKTIEILSILVDWINNANLKSIDLNIPMSGDNKVIENFVKYYH